MTDDYQYQYRIPKWKVVSALVAVAVVLFGITAIFAHPFRKTNAGVVAISYGGGPFEGAQFQKVVGPGSGLVNNGLFDKWYEYPSTQRNYIASSDPSEGDKKQSDSLPCRDSDRVDQKVQVTVTLALNTNDDTLRSFHEKVGLKYHAWEGGEYTDGRPGWDAALNDYLRKPLETSVQEACRKFTTDELRSGQDVLTKISNEIASQLKTDTNALAGADYFCGPSFKRGQDLCPEFKVSVTDISPTNDDIPKAYNKNKASAIAVQTAKNEAQAKREQAAGDQAAADAATNLSPAYLHLKEIEAQLACAQSANCTLVVTPGGNDVNVNTGGR